MTNDVKTSIQEKVSFNKYEDATVNRVANNESTLTAPVTDPNFNVMRKDDPETDKAKFYVVGLLVAATIVPVLAWLLLR